VTKRKNIIFEQIKKQNGEHFAKAIKKLHSGIFEIPGIVETIRYAGRDPEPVLKYLISLKKIHIEETDEYKDPLELLAQAGYDAYYVHNLREQNAIEHYFAPGEELCTFFDATRFQRFYIINAVKKNVDEIKRRDFLGREKREDDYGRSVISIQIAKDGSSISIKNRYNDAVANPDNTFNSNPDEIQKGLASALRKKFKVDFSSHAVTLPSNYTLWNNRILRYHTWVGDSYIGADFVACGDDITMIDKNTELILDHWIFNSKTREIKDIAPDYYEPDGFPEVLLNEIQGKAIQIIKNPDYSHTLLADGKPVLKEKEGQIVELTITADKIPSTKPFLSHNTSIESFSIPNIRFLPNNVLTNDVALKKLYAPKVQKFGNNCFCESQISVVDLPKAQIFGDNFMDNNIYCHTFNAPNAAQFGDFCLNQNKFIQSFCFPHLVRIGDDFAIKNQIVREFIAPNLQDLGRYFLASDLELESLDLPAATALPEGFLNQNIKLRHLGAENVTYIDNECLPHNLLLEELSLPNVETIEADFMPKNKKMKRFFAPKLNTENIGANFFASNPTMRNLFFKKSPPTNGGPLLAGHNLHDMD